MFFWEFSELTVRCHVTPKQHRTLACCCPVSLLWVPLGPPHIDLWLQLQ